MADRLVLPIAWDLSQVVLPAAWLPLDEVVPGPRNEHPQDAVRTRS